MKENLYRQVVSGVIWRFSERISAQLVTVIVSIILARIITPEEYGIVSLITIFITFANVFVSDGFGKTLIQGKDIDNIDFSTIFYFNIIFSLCLYIVLYVGATSIATFYDEPLIIPTLRILGLRIPIAAVNSVQQAYVSRNMLFKKFFLSTLIGTVFSGIIGVYMAYAGYGVWALVMQYLVNSVINTVILWNTVRWRPNWTFKVSRLRRLIVLGWNLLFTSLLNSFYDNLRSLIIGRKYTTADLAQYTKGIQYPDLIISNLNTTISSVLYPAFSKLQDNKMKLKQALRKSISMNTYIVFPVMLGLFAVAPELVVLLLTEKWLPCVPYLRIACIYLALYPINTANLQAIIALGNGKVYFKLSLIKKIIGIGLIVFSIPFGVMSVALSEVISSLFAVFTNIGANRKLLNYSVKEFLEDISKNAILAIFMCIIVIFCGKILSIFIKSIFLIISFKIIIGVFLFLFFSIVFKYKELNFIKYQIANVLRKVNKK